MKLRASLNIRKVPNVGEENQFQRLVTNLHWRFFYHDFAVKYKQVSDGSHIL